MERRCSTKIFPVSSRPCSHSESCSDVRKAFYLKPSKDSVKHDATLYLSQYGSEASPSYTIRHPDPASPDSRNRYAAALCDSYHPDIIFGEVLLIPEWTQPNPSQEDIRKNGGVPPPPQPILPNQFVIQLYNPDQQIAVRHHPSTWNSAQHWDFDMPQQTFRQPSASTLDRTQSDPTVSEATPKIEFKWKREGKLSKDLLCNLSGKTRNPDGSKRRNKEPDIPVSQDIVGHFLLPSKVDEAQREGPRSSSEWHVHVKIRKANPDASIDGLLPQPT